MSRGPRVEGGREPRTTLDLLELHLQPDGRVLVLVNGEPIVQTRCREAWSPRPANWFIAELMGQPSHLSADGEDRPDDIPIAFCGCGEYACSGVAVRVVRRAATVAWTRLLRYTGTGEDDDGEPLDFVFDRMAYEQEVVRVLTLLQPPSRLRKLEILLRAFLILVRNGRQSGAVSDGRGHPPSAAEFVLTRIRTTDFGRWDG